MDNRQLAEIRGGRVRATPPGRPALAVGRPDSRLSAHMGGIFPGAGP